MCQAHASYANEKHATMNLMHRAERECLHMRNSPLQQLKLRLPDQDDQKTRPTRLLESYNRVL